MHLLTNILVTILCRLIPWKMLYVIGKKLLRTTESMDNFKGRDEQLVKTAPKGKSK